jgi:hypothetical protein
VTAARELTCVRWEEDGRRMGGGWEEDGRRMGGGWEEDEASDGR